MEKINLVELLKDCPKGTKFYTPLCGEVEFDAIKDFPHYPIRTTTNNNYYCFTKEGYYETEGVPECLLFPSKDQRDWSKYQRPFVNGDIVHGHNAYCSYISIYKSDKDNDSFNYYVSINSAEIFRTNTNAAKENLRFATEEEKQKLFKAIKDNGYQWNAETKTLELIRPKFKDGDIVATYDGKYIAIIKNNDGKYYVCCHLNSNYFHIDQSGWFDRLATKEEKQKLFQMIKDKGYKWNDQIKKLEVLITPNFKVGDVIQNKDAYKVKITAINEDEFYEYESLIAKGIGTITFEEQYNWELVEYQVGDHFVNSTNSILFIITEIRCYGDYKIQDLYGSSHIVNKHYLHKYLKVPKWDLKWFKPFDKVLVRNSFSTKWTASYFSHYDNSTHKFAADGRYYEQCIPYNEETKHLIGTNLEEPEFYKN